jgi:hypothetical protein
MSFNGGFYWCRNAGVPRENHDLPQITDKLYHTMLYRVHLSLIAITIRGGRLRYKRYDATFLKKSSVELPFSSFGDHLINILRKVNRLIYVFKIK